MAPPWAQTAILAGLNSTPEVRSPSTTRAGSSPSSLQATISIVPPPPMASRCIGANTRLQQKLPLWRSRTRSWMPRIPPKEAAGRRVKRKKMQIRALWSRTAKATTGWRWFSRQSSRAGPMDPSGGSHAANSCSSAFASFRSRVSNPSVNHPYTGANSSRACCILPWSRQRRARLMEARSSQDFACC